MLWLFSGTWCKRARRQFLVPVLPLMRYLNMSKFFIFLLIFYIYICLRQYARNSKVSNAAHLLREASWWNIILSVLQNHHLLEGRGYINVILWSQPGPNSEPNLVLNNHVKTGELFSLSESQFLHLWIRLLQDSMRKMQ